MEFASSTVGWVFNRLGSMAAEELRSLKDVGEDLERLRSILSIIRDVLEDAEARQVKEKAVAGWLKKLKDVAFDIDDVLDEIAAPENIPDKSGCKERVRKFFSSPKSLKFRHEMAKKIKEIRERLDTIYEEKDRYHLRVGAASEHSEAEGNRETGSFVDKSEVYGRDEDKKRIIDFLLHKCNEQNLGVISIVGLGGLGKTTLAQLVCNDDERVAKHFETKIWVYVSQKFDIKNVIASMAESITKKKFELSSNRDLIEQELLVQIKGKRFLLVLDDVWNEDSEIWDGLGRLLKNGAKGSKVIVTTRNARVSDVMKSDESLSLGVLSDDECWKLFKKHAFKSDDDDAKNRNLVAIGKEIVKKCGGLPLAAKAIGSTLYNKREETWRAVRDDENWTQLKDEKDIILPALMLSYNRLSPPLKQFFAYCSIFPKGFEIEVKMLVQLWTAEGFVVDSSSGSEYVGQLISRSLLEEVIRNGEVIKDEVKMHDMVHNLAQFVAGDECSIVDTTSGNITNFPPKSRYASLVLNEVTPSTTQILSSGQKLRTFHLRAIIQGDKDSSHQVLETIVSNMQLLRALHLAHLPLEELPATITKLLHLRYLDLSYTTGLKSFPKTIGLLYNLQTLKLNNTEVVTLPESIGGLVKLLTLEIFGCMSLHSLPNTIGKLERLQYLNLSHSVNLEALPPTIDTLQCLQTLDLSYCWGLKELPESIGGLRNLVNLHLRVCPSLYSLPDTIGKLERLQYLDLLYDNKLQALPPTIGTLQCLQTLDLSYCGELKELLESIGGLRNLVNLHLRSCSSLYSLPDTIGKLERLQYLDLSYNDKLQALPPTIGTLQCLQTLDLSYCGELKELSESIGSLRNLVNLHLQVCSSLYSLPDAIGKLERLQYLGLSNDDNLQALPPTIGTLECLQTLELSFCGELKELPESIGGLKNLVNLHLQGCSSLYSLPDTIGKLERLQYLGLSNNDNLQALPPTIGTLQCLQTLDLSSCGKLKELPESIGGLKNLVKLNLRGCRSLYSLPDKLGCMSNLQVLDISYLYALKTLPESFCSLYNLQRLDIDHCYSLTSMPAGIGRLSQLRNLPPYVLGDGENCVSLAELGTLMNLEGHLCIKNLQIVKDVAEASDANLREKQRLNSLGLEWDFDVDWNRGSYKGIDDFENKRKELIERVADMDGERVKLLEGVLSNLQPHQKLERLRMKGYVGKMLPGWMMDLSYVVELKLESCARCDNLQALEKLSCLVVLELKRFPFIQFLPRLGQLPRLRVLILHMLPGIKCLSSELYGGVGAFPALEKLELDMMLGLEEWSGNSISNEGDDFLSCLSTLAVKDCPKLRALPPTVFPSVECLAMNIDDGLLLSYLERGAFPNLKVFWVYNCIDTNDESSMPEALVQRLHSVPFKSKFPKQIRWDHSVKELEKMRLETLERIAIEIEKKLVIEPSSSS